LFIDSFAICCVDFRNNDDNSDDVTDCSPALSKIMAEIMAKRTSQIRTKRGDYPNCIHCRIKEFSTYVRRTVRSHTVRKYI
jgi:hypothetical protein